MKNEMMTITLESFLLVNISERNHRFLSTRLEGVKGSILNGER